MKRFFSLFVLLCLLPMVAMAAKINDPAKPYKLKMGDEERIYYMYAPKGDTGAPQPVVFVFHGGGGSPLQVADSTGFSKMAEEGDFIVVYPEGSGFLKTWNAGTCCGYAERNSVDDVAFTKAILEDLQKYYTIDEQRIYATGMSNGGMMAYRLACDMGGTFAAIAPVAGAMNTEVCMTESRTSLAAFHALDDKHVLYEGGVSEEGLRVMFGKKAAPDKSVNETMLYWLGKNACRRIPSVERKDGYTITTFFCTENREVKLYTLGSGGHSWPGGKAPARPGADMPFEGLDATKAIWEFFTYHPPRPLF